jgi:hypothetical protein
MKHTTMMGRLAVLAGTALVTVLAISGVALAAGSLVVTKTVPSGGATGVAPTANIDAYFNHDVAASTVKSRKFKIRKKGTTTWLSATRSVDNTISPTSTNGLSESMATLNPSADLAPNTIYQVVIVGGTTGVKGVNGEILSTNKRWTFTTSPTSDPMPPETSITAGPSGATNDSTPTFEFSGSDNITPSTSLTYECRIDSGTFAACTSPYTALALPDGAHTFEVRAKDAAKNVDGSPASRVFTVDTAAPDTSITSGPAEGATESVGSVSFGFSSTEPGSTFECKLDAGSYASCTSPNDYSNLANGAHTFSVRATDPAGNTDASPASRTWTVDTVAPTVESVSPANAATGVASTTNVTATFSEAMNSSSISSQTFTLKQQGSTSQLGAVISYDSTTRKATLDPSTDLAPNTTYTATLTTGVKDAAGNTLAQELSWSFTTGIAGPTVVSYAPTGDPAPGLSTNVTATFSTAMDPSTITTSTFTLTGPGSSGSLAAQVTYDSASKTATLDPSANLSAGTTYTALIKSGSNGVKDLQGNSLAQDFSWNFTACDGGIVLSAQSITPMGLVIC